MEINKNRYSVPAMEKGLAIIETLAKSKQPLGITDIFAICGLPKSTIFMILTTLETLDYVEKLDGDKYKLTLKLYHLGMNIFSKLDIRQVARPIMEQLSEQLRFTVHLAKLDHGKAMYIEKVSGPGFVQFSTAIGHTWPLYISAGGKVLAAYMPEDKLDEMIDAQGFQAYTANSITTKEALKEILQSVRENGYALEDEEGENGIRCVAAPVFDKSGQVVAAVSITALRNELPANKFHEVGLILRDKALLISEQLGYVKPIQSST